MAKKPEKKIFVSLDKDRSKRREKKFESPANDLYREEFLQKLLDNNGNFPKTCAEMHVDMRTVIKYADKYPDSWFTKKLEEIWLAMDAAVEGALWKSAISDSTKAHQDRKMWLEARNPKKWARNKEIDHKVTFEVKEPDRDRIAEAIGDIIDTDFKEITDEPVPKGLQAPQPHDAPEGDTDDGGGVEEDTEPDSDILGEEV